ncbi:superoxide dismutase[Cu-Zn] [Sphingomonas sp. DT-204]
MGILEESNQPLTAYEIARQSSDRGSPISPTQVYRILNRLITRGTVQRIELLAAYHASRGEKKGYMICRCCRSVESFPSSAFARAVDRVCRAAGFSASHAIFELSGICAECAGRSTAPQARSTRPKEEIMAFRMKSLLALVATAGAVVTAIPADAAERRPGILYDGAGRELGTVAVTDAPKGVLLRIEAKGLPPGWHGIHFHEKADCGGAAFKSAGGHVHSQKPIVHGFLVEDANDAGDLPNIHVTADGGVTVELYSTLVSAEGRGGRPALKDGDGSALVIHANPDDYRTQPIGGAGERIACAIIP